MAGGGALPPPLPPAMCHSNTLHAAFVNIHPCPRIRITCEHICLTLCGCSEDRGPFVMAVEDVELPCGHRVNNLPCYKTLQLDKIRCLVEVAKTTAHCGHAVTVACAVDVASTTFKCPTPCTHVLPCGHTCPGSCSMCTQGEVVDHKSCSHPCGRRLDTCEHICKKTCHSGTPCGQCQRKCEVRYSASL